MKMKKLRCLLGIHYRQECFAPFILEGTEGELRTWVCKKCDYKNEKGVFVPKKTLTK